MTSVEKALICAVLLALPAAISCARSAPLQQEQQPVAHLSSPSSAAQLSGRRLQQSLPGYDDAPDSDTSLRPDLPYAGGVGTGVVGGDAAMVDKIGTGFGETVTVCLEEEYGYQRWIWRTGMTPTRLIAWWKALPTVVPFWLNALEYNPPGDLIPYYGWCYDGDREPDWWYAHIHTDYDSYLSRDMESPTVFLHEGYDGEMHETLVSGSPATSSSSTADSTFVGPSKPLGRGTIIFSRGPYITEIQTEI
uniref:Uncharacterized protein n=1 Tax=Phaeocystis cordata TaxID=118079 RepID=A0A7S1HQ38_9EUKA|mmetsp:Transcript_1564/g.3553  ORF Transcript_1564/g.3553 Transcript_1564/m.3553 type:complete len:249 (+) Transcript_1564:128-874(+)